MIAGPAVGTVATFSLRAPFFLYAGTLVVAGAIGLARCATANSRRARSQRAGRSRCARRAAQPAYRAALAASFAGDFAWSARGRRSSAVRHRRPRLGANWAYAAFLIVSLVSGALLLPVGRSPTRSAGGRSSASGCWSARPGYLLLPTLHATAGLVAGACCSAWPGRRTR